MMNELKPCPICGGKADIIVGDFLASRAYTIKCTNCGLHTDWSCTGKKGVYLNGAFRWVFTSDIETVNKIKDKWNKRFLKTAETS